MSIFLAIVIVAAVFVALIFIITLMITASARALRRNYYNPPMPDMKHPVMPAMPTIASNTRVQASRQKTPVKPRDPLGVAAESLKEFGLEYNKARLLLRIIASARTLQDIPPGIMNQFASMGFKTEQVAGLLKLAAASRDGESFDFASIDGIPPQTGHAIYTALWRFYASQR